MFIMTLDVKSTHCRNPECPSRIAQQPNGSWMCVDCGMVILQKLIDTDTPLGGLVEDDIPIHVTSDTRTPDNESDSIDGRERRTKHLDSDVCAICGFPLVKSMTNLYYFCPTCGIDVPRERIRGNTTVSLGKHHG